jgi:hypothetical protein
MTTLFRAPVSTYVLVPLTMCCLTIIPGFAAGPGADKDAAPVFKPGRAVTYPAKLAQDKVTVAVKPYERDEDLRAAFGKTPLAQYGVLPVLVVIDNDSNKAVRLKLRVEFITGDNRRIVATPAADVPYLKNAKAPSAPGQSSPLPIPLPKKKNKLQSWEVDGRAFAARMVPPGESVSGFFYFQTSIWKDSRVYMDGLSDAASGKEFLYYEIPIE